VFDLAHTGADTPLSPNGKNVGIGEMRIGNSLMTAVGLGSCVALILHDKRRNVGAMAHVMLPEGESPDRPGKFATTAVPALIEALISSGSRKSSLMARLVGGACMFQNFNGKLNIGGRNVAMLRSLLEQHGVAVETEDIGGTKGRTVVYNPADGGAVFINRADGTCEKL
jgi:chemotaxis protein CheD